MGVASINSIMCPQFGQFYKKVVLRLGEHGDVIETQTVRLVPPTFFSKLGPCFKVHVHFFHEK